MFVRLDAPYRDVGSMSGFDCQCSVDDIGSYRLGSWATGVDDNFGLALLVVDLEPDGNENIIDNRNSLSRVLSNE